MLTDQRFMLDRLEAGGEEALRALDRLRKNHYHLYRAVQEARRNPDVLDEWGRAPKRSQGWRNLIFYEQALRVLEVVLSDR